MTPSNTWRGWRGWRGWVVPSALLGLAEWALHHQAVPSDALAPPSATVKALLALAGDGSLWQALHETLGAAAAGLGLGGGLGLLVGLWFGLAPRAAGAASLSVELLRPVPSVALIPLAMLVFGFGYRMEIAVVAFTCLWPMLLLTQAAVRQVEPRLLEVGRVLRLSFPAQLVKLVLPAAAPRILVAFRLAVGIALTVAVTVEVAANPQGLGYAMMSAQQALMPDQTFALLLTVGLLGWCLNVGLLAIERRLFSHAGETR